MSVQMEMLRAAVAPANQVTARKFYTSSKDLPLDHKVTKVSAPGPKSLNCTSCTWGNCRFDLKIGFGFEI